MEWERLDEIRDLLEAGDNAGAMSGLLNTVAELMEQVDVLNVQMEALLEALDSDNGEEDMDDDCSYIVTCPGCGCMLELEGWLLDEEDAELSCPQCGEILEL